MEKYTTRGTTAQEPCKLFVFFIAGPARAGKDTVASMIGRKMAGRAEALCHRSAVSPINDILLQLGWDGVTKDALYRAAAAALLDFMAAHPHPHQPLQPVRKVADAIVEDLKTRMLQCGVPMAKSVTVQVRQPYLIEMLTEDIMEVLEKSDISAQVTFTVVYVDPAERASDLECFHNSADSVVSRCKEIADYVIDNDGPIYGIGCGSLAYKVGSMLDSCVLPELYT